LDGQRAKIGLSAAELAVWLEANVPESFTVFDLPLEQAHFHAPHPQRTEQGNVQHMLLGSITGVKIDA
jgi:hypothetical protein